MTKMTKLVLLPRPRRATDQAGTFAVTGGTTIECHGDAQALLPIAKRLANAVWETQRVRWAIGAGTPAATGANRVVLRLDGKAGIAPQGYRLRVAPGRVELTASAAVGVFYGVMTLRQILRQVEGAISAAAIDDRPDFPSRGVMIDVSRAKVPTLETLFAMIDQFAEMKINHVELYTEHTFAYGNHREVWAKSSPITGEDVLRLDAYCRERFVELVPNQNSFGHMHRWLSLPRYRRLAEFTEPWTTPWGGRCEGPFSFDPSNPGVLKLLDELFSELLPHFSSRKFNVGCDETFDLGHGKSKALCEKKGTGRVYLEFLRKIHRLVKRHGRTMHFWGDIILQHPELVPQLPRDVVALVWGYEADHPYEQQCRRFAETDLAFYVCPGTSAWNSLAGRTANALPNIRLAARCGLKYGAKGLLNTDWGDGGHWQYLPVSYLGYAAGAALSWCYSANKDEDFVAGLDRHVFHDAAGVMGRTVHDLGNAYLKLRHRPGNSTVFYPLLQNGWDLKLDRKVTTKALQATMEYIDAVTEHLRLARMARPDADLVCNEYTNTVRLMRHACRRGLAIRESKTGDARLRRALATDMREIIGEHRRLWIARNRVGGLDESTAAFEARLKEYE